MKHVWCLAALALWTLSGSVWAGETTQQRLDRMNKRLAELKNPVNENQAAEQATEKKVVETAEEQKVTETATEEKANFEKNAENIQTLFEKLHKLRDEKKNAPAISQQVLPSNGNVEQSQDSAGQLVTRTVAVSEVASGNGYVVPQGPEYRNFILDSPLGKKIKELQEAGVPANPGREYRMANYPYVSNPSMDNEEGLRYLSGDGSFDDELFAQEHPEKNLEWTRQYAQDTLKYRYVRNADDNKYWGEHLGMPRWGESKPDDGPMDSFWKFLGDISGVNRFMNSVNVQEVKGHSTASAVGLTLFSGALPISTVSNFRGDWRQNQYPCDWKYQTYGKLSDAEMLGSAAKNLVVIPAMKLGTEVGLPVTLGIAAGSGSPSGGVGLLNGPGSSGSMATGPAGIH